jgi:hypothetical protein
MQSGVVRAICRFNHFSSIRDALDFLVNISRKEIIDQLISWLE